MKQLLTILIVFIALVGFSQNESDAKADKILRDFSLKVNGSSTVYLEFSASIKNAGGATENNIGKGWAKADKYYATYGEMTRVSNGKKIWTIIKEEKSIYVSDEDDKETSINPKRMMTLWDKDYKSKYDKEYKLGNDAVHVINLYPKNVKSSEYHTIIVYIGKTDNELKKAILKGKDGTTMTYTITKLEFNADAPDSKFTFDKTKFPGYQIIED
ncbi:MAG: outer membrane lipoprotein carrier protein LolA [Crocinitomicaceae bacterium]|nr:outer membrane lipoprotein carrier protein LolA [Crocinitomicaceae bacterium]